MRINDLKSSYNVLFSVTYLLNDPISLYLNKKGLDSRVA